MKKILVIMWSRSFVLLSMALFALAAGCAPVKINTTALVPGRFDQAAQFKKVAVLPFEGPQGAEFASEIEGVLASVTINDKPYFEVVDRASIDKILAEMKLSMTGLVDPSTAAKVGNIVGARGIYTGAITASTVNDTKYSEKRTRCASEVTKKDSKGHDYQDCERWEDYYVPCVKRTATFAFTPKLIEVETGRVLYSNTLEKRTMSSACVGRKSLADAVEMKRNVQEAVKESFREDVAPHYVTIQISLMDSTSDIDSKEATQKVKSGLDFAKHNRLDRGCELWTEAKTLSPKSVTILYNLGVCAEVESRLDDAQSLYKEADRLMMKPDDRVTIALARISEAIQKRKKLNLQVAQ